MVREGRRDELLRHRIQLRQEFLQIPHLPLETLAVRRRDDRARLRRAANVRRGRNPLLQLLDLHVEALIVHDRVLMEGDMARLRLIWAVGGAGIRRGCFEVGEARRSDGRRLIDPGIIDNGHDRSLRLERVLFISLLEASSTRTDRGDPTGRCGKRLGIT